MIELYIVRHGETVWNTEKRMQGRKDSPLTKKGIRQANELAKRIKDIRINVIYSSPLGRAMKTAKILRAQRNIPIIKDDRLMEIDLGDWEGLDEKEIKVKNSKELYNFGTNPKIYKPDNGEKFEQVKIRAVSLIKDIMNNCAEKHVLIVTHTITLKTMMAYFENTSLEKFWDSPYIYQASLSQVNITKGKAKVILHGDYSHLTHINSIQ
ncbi:histidine phosphatase family protein [Clostridium sp. AWRP]|uniref:histidine phosphatase family protein n=1 Tax=Clostridium sp. AWRP TaxID=2212991 RepID=UPI000FDAB743|nr:histidine phosphatase family protein [Clostridium sp. AWRP]AZV58781.1 histidine phosphatase family protein [Clostridium sp. AWRP]